MYNITEKHVSITATELKKALGKYLDYVIEEKKPIYVLRHGKIVAVLDAVNVKSL